MDTELQKRIKEAAEVEQRKITQHKGLGDVNYGFIKGAEYGYKEAIALAREWMKNYFPEELDGKGFEFVKLETILADFEADMNKLWEEQK